MELESFRFKFYWTITNKLYQTSVIFRSEKRIVQGICVKNMTLFSDFSSLFEFEICEVVNCTKFVLMLIEILQSKRIIIPLVEFWFLEEPR